MTQVLLKALKWIEIGTVLIFVVAIFLKLLSLPGAAELLLFSLSTLAVVYFLWSSLVAPKPSGTSKPTLVENLPGTLSKISFIGVSVLCIAYLFTTLHLNGANEIMIIGLLTVVICVAVSMLMILGNRERMTKLQAPLVRSVVALLFYFITPLLK